MLPVASLYARIYAGRFVPMVRSPMRLTVKYLTATCVPVLSCYSLQHLLRYVDFSES